MSKFIQYGNKTLTMPEGMTLEQAKQLMARHFACAQIVEVQA